MVEGAAGSSSHAPIAGNRSVTFAALKAYRSRPQAREAGGTACPTSENAGLVVVAQAVPPNATWHMSQWAVWYTTAPWAAKSGASWRAEAFVGLSRIGYPHFDDDGNWVTGARSAGRGGRGPGR